MTQLGDTLQSTSANATRAAAELLRVITVER
jgi:hypothetical protein